MHYVKALLPRYSYNFIILPLVHKYSTKASSHYDILGLSPKASHAEVKAAYYAQSKLYHPDRNDGDDNAANKFRAISEAYEVLGNVKLRRLYDRGFLQLSQSAREYRDDPSVNFYRSRRNKPPPPTGKTPIYDFDEWSRSHYGATFARDMRIKANKQKIEVDVARNQSQDHNERVLFGVMAGFVFMMYFMTSTGGNRNDRVLENDDGRR